jgi:hypothetical protein
MSIGSKIAKYLAVPTIGSMMYRISSGFENQKSPEEMYTQQGMLGPLAVNAYKNLVVGENMMMSLAAGFGAEIGAGRLISKGAKLAGMDQKEITRIANTNRYGSSSAQAKLRTAGIQQNALSKLKWGARLRTASRILSWMPIAHLAFEGISSLASIPSPMKQQRPPRTSSISGTFVDTSAAFTQRQRALQMIHDSQYSGRAALGNEASMMHQ